MTNTITPQKTHRTKKHTATGNTLTTDKRTQLSSNKTSLRPINFLLHTATHHRVYPDILHINHNLGSGQHCRRTHSTLPRRRDYTKTSPDSSLVNQHKQRIPLTQLSQEHSSAITSIQSTTTIFEAIAYIEREPLNLFKSGPLPTKQ